MIEIERKFLVKNQTFKSEAFRKTKIVQGFLSSHKARTVRVRVRGNKGFLTIKGQSTSNGLSRFEWENEIKLEEAKALLELCEKGVIEKIRYEIKLGSCVFEVDEFLGDNKGLIVAEIELNSENQEFSVPKWLGEEVTGQIQYYNSQLSKNPFCNWTS